MSAKKGKETRAKNKEERTRKLEHEAARKWGEGSSKDPDEEADTTGSGQVES